MNRSLARLAFVSLIAAGVSFAAAAPEKPKFWAFTPPVSPTLPSVKNTAWATNPLDRFILAGLEAKGLKPAPPADRRTLIRRATLDLTGLPPTVSEIRDFLADTKAGAFARVVDRLLASPAYGERWGRHWLDVARYADSNGVDENLVYTQAWRYRDYVIRAFNQDKPIDRFIQEQLAGDLLPRCPDEEADHDRLIATGYLSLGPKMLAEDDPVKQEMDVIDEQIDTLGKTFMGLTIGCARCHDHKFDPLPQKDYYALASIFKSTKTMLNYKNMAEWQEIPLVSNAEREKDEAAAKAIKEKRTAREALIKKHGDAALAEAKGKAEQYRLAALEALKIANTELKPAIMQANPPDGGTSAGGGTSALRGAVLVEAEDFVRGNVLKDRDGFGKGIGVLVNAGQYPNRTEYDVELPAAGNYQLDLRYASGDARPIRVYVNGALVLSNAAGKVTGGFNPDAQKWFAEGVFAFKAGKNTVKFERDSYFPHIDKFLLAASSAPVTRDLAQVAADAGLVDAFLSQVVLKGRESPQSIQAAQSLQSFEFELPEKPDRVFPAAVQAEVKSLDEAIAALEKAKPKLPRAMSVSEGKPTDLKVHIRGNYLTLGAPCTRGFPAVLTTGAEPPIAIEKSGRLELAQWMTRPHHPLTARVFVNRVWRWHFGKGLVGSTDNFGKLGERPVNQGLLDWLAVAFATSNDGILNTKDTKNYTKDTKNTENPGNSATLQLPNSATLQLSNSATPQLAWSLKKLHRLIMLTNTYQMSSKFDARAAQIDPENRLHWRADRRRLEVEAIRDSILAVSGQIDRTLGGSLLNFRDREYVTSTANADPVNYKSNRRSVYLPVIRSALYDVYTAFDFGDPTVMNGDRPTTTVAPQALFMMNSALVLEQTKAMAARLLAMKELDDAGRYRLAFEECYGRVPSAAEVTRAMSGMRQLDAAYAASEKDLEKRRIRVWQSICKTLVGGSEFVFVD